MLGYLKPDFKKMNDKCRQEYRSFYCGLCHSIKSRYGIVGITSLNYELTLFLVLLFGTTPLKNTTFKGSCTITPFLFVRYLDYLQYEFCTAADLSVLIAGYEIKDNLLDSDNMKWKLADTMFKYPFKKSQNSLHEGTDSIENSLKTYYSYENSEYTSFADAVEAAGNLIEKIVEPLLMNSDKINKPILLEIANYIGRWIYLLDACDDYLVDKKNNDFNPIVLLKNSQDIYDVVKDVEFKIISLQKKLHLQNYKELINYIITVDMPQKSDSLLQMYSVHLKRLNKCESQRTNG